LNVVTRAIDDEILVITPKDLFFLKFTYKTKSKTKLLIASK